MACPPSAGKGLQAASLGYNPGDIHRAYGFVTAFEIKVRATRLTRTKATSGVPQAHLACGTNGGNAAP
jgi:hypothetical protein